MVRTEVISVNPGNTAEGARFVNVSARCAARIARRPVLSVRKSFPVLNFLFPTQNAGVEAFSYSFGSPDNCRRLVDLCRNRRACVFRDGL